MAESWHGFRIHGHGIKSNQNFCTCKANRRVNAILFIALSLQSQFIIDNSFSQFDEYVCSICRVSYSILMD